MKWKKLGKIFCASGQSAHMFNGGRTPVPFFIDEDTLRIYFAAYDEAGRGRIFYLECDMHDPTKVTNLSTTPSIDLGNIGFYDDNGIITSDIVQHEDKIFLYTIGFSLKNKLLFDAATGLAISQDGGMQFTKLAGPVLDRGVDDPCFAASPSVMYENGLWRMWYVSCDHWEPHGNGYKHFYNIKYRESHDGIYWNPKATVCIDYANEHEYAISRPSVIKGQDGVYRMWYSFRAQPGVATYRIGYAESPDGRNWTRQDEKMRAFDVSPTGWDSEMICYPYVFEHKNTLYMLYNGNGYGKTGFGLAVLEKE